MLPWDFKQESEEMIVANCCPELIKIIYMTCYIIEICKVGKKGPHSKIDAYSRQMK